MIDLKKGANPLIYKVQQGVGGVFFHAKITDPKGRPLDSIIYSLAPAQRDLKLRSTAPSSAAIEELEISERRIRFKTKALHEPHIIKFSYFPNWKVRGAKHVYHVTPNFMLVYPEEEEVTLYYASLFPDHAGRLLTLVGALIFAGMGISRLARKRS